jgi:hypothetical protein
VFDPWSWPDEAYGSLPDFTIPQAEEGFPRAFDGQKAHAPFTSPEISCG